MFGKSIFKNYSGFINLFSRIADPFIVALSAIVAYGLRFSFINLSLPINYQILILFAVLCVGLVFPVFRLYASWRGQTLTKLARAIVVSWLTVVLLIIVILFGLKISSDYSRLWLGAWFGLGLVFLVTFRLCIYGFLQYQRQRGRNFRRVVIVGAGDLGKKLIAQVMESPWAGFKIIGLFDDSSKLQKSYIYDYEVIGPIDEVNAFLEENQTDEIWIALPLRAEQRVKDLLYSIRHYTVNIKLIPDIFGFSLLNHSMTEVVGLPAVNLSDTPMGGGNRLIKEMEDRVLALLILVLISPLGALIAIAIKCTSPGPVLFKQKRHGWDGRVINVYKFRTMEVHQEEKNQITQACRDDPRVTSVGKFLRRTSLDELPQFYNVLQGRMSIVGPRPHALQHNEEYKNKVDKYMLRHMVKPGITGWAQVNGYRGETDTLEKMKKRIEYDLFYIENWSVWFDLKIICLTLFIGFINKNAY